ncbi:MAG TPA: XRE family transcriptional regulator [Silvibacterium sp.]|jgi:Zn-dependent peptidase ImmA (M78 family)/DNA-binding XRE family transcriptional regulator|nr:XRE family transcriptional regulator [Silvibacterium sp.]
MSRPSTKGYFVRERLVEARDALGITQQELAQALGKSDSTISNWETGHQSPEPISLQRLSTTLNLPTQYFLRTMPEYGSCAIFFRSLANAAARARTREKARMRWLQHASLALQSILDFPPVNFPQLLAEDGYGRLSFADLEEIATDVRKYWNLGEGPISSMVLVAENAGVVFGIDRLGSTSIDGQSTWCSFDNRPYILLNSDKYTAFRRQMDVAHEISHLILHNGVTETALERDFDLIEAQAKYLANAILLPHKSFSAELYSLSLDGLLSLKPRWKVSVGAMIMRAHQLDILSDEAERRLWKYRASRGWHRREPYDLPTETPVEEPRLLRRSIEMLVTQKIRSTADLLYSDICLPAVDLEMIAVLPRGYFGISGNVTPLIRLKEESGTVVPFKRST